MTKQRKIERTEGARIRSRKASAPARDNTVKGWDKEGEKRCQQRDHGVGESSVARIVLQRQSRRQEVGEPQVSCRARKEGKKAVDGLSGGRKVFIRAHKTSIHKAESVSIRSYKGVKLEGRERQRKNAGNMNGLTKDSQST